MKKTRIFFRNVVVMTLMVVLISGSSCIMTSAAPRVGCSHSHQVITIGSRYVEWTHNVKVQIGAAILTQTCHVNTKYQTKITTCADCNLKLSEVDTAILSETHSISHD